MPVSTTLLGEDPQLVSDTSDWNETQARFDEQFGFFYRPRTIRIQGSAEPDVQSSWSRSAYLVCRVSGLPIAFTLATGDTPTNRPMECFLVYSDLGATHGTSGAVVGPLAKSYIPKEISDRLDYLASLPPNWDDEGISQVTQHTIDRAKSLLEAAFSIADGIPLPFISPAYDGMLVAEWVTNAGKELILDIPTSPNDNPAFLLVEPQPDGGEQETDAELGDKWTIEQVIRRLLDN